MSEEKKAEQDERAAFEAEWKRSGWGDADTKNQCFHFWQARAASTSANVAQGAEAGRERIARALHYPACWDTAAYPTLDSAAWEAIACAKLGCSTCGEPK